MMHSQASVKTLLLRSRETDNIMYKELDTCIGTNKMLPCEHRYVAQARCMNIISITRTILVVSSTQRRSDRNIVPSAPVQPY